jgi:hypothetical protein
VRLGPVALTFAGIVKFEQIDEASRTARVRAQGTDAKGRGGAQATAAFRLEPSANGSKVLVHTDLALSGAVAQYGRGVGVIQSTAAQLMKQFAANLQAQLAASHPVEASANVTDAQPTSRSQAPAAHAQPAAARPISGFSLIAKVILDAFVRLWPFRKK